MDWREAIVKFETEAKAIEFKPPDEVLRLFKHQIVPTGQGTNGQAFTTMVFAQGDARALAYYNVLCLIRLVDQPSFNLDHMRTLFREFVPLSAEFLGTCGLETVWEFVQDMLGILDSLETKEQFKELLDALGYYVSALHGWVHHFFPWYVGEMFPQKKKEDVEEMAALMK